VHDVDRLSGADKPARSILKDEPIAVNVHNPNTFVPIGEEGVNRGVDANVMAQTNLCVGRNGCTDHPQLPSFEVNPQRLAKSLEALERLGRPAPHWHHRIQSEPAHRRVSGHLVEEGCVRGSGYDSANDHSFKVVPQ
jgi:hypothetical protein